MLIATSDEEAASRSESSALHCRENGHLVGGNSRWGAQMNSIAAIIGERGEVELPPSVLRQLGLGPHDHVEIVVDNGEVRIVPTTRTALESTRAENAARRRAALAPISRAFEHESVKDAEAAVAAALAEVRAEAHRDEPPTNART